MENKEKENDGLEKKDQGVTVDVEAMVAKAVEKLAEKIVELKGGNSSDSNNLKGKLMSDFSGGNAKVAYPADLQNLTKDQKTLYFFKSLIGRAKDQFNPDHDRAFKALVEGTDGDGGYLVPEEFRSEVFRIATDVGVMRRIATVVPMNTDTLNLNTLNARPQAYWTPEYGSKTTSSAEFGRVVLQPNDLVCLLPITHQLIADANINMVQFITNLFAESIALAEDKAFFTGSGTGQPKGINQETITTVAGNLTMDAVIALIDSVPSRVRNSPTAGFVANSYVKRILRTLKNGSNDYIWRDGGGSGNNSGETKRLPDTLYGYFFEEQNDLENALYFGDWKYYLIGDRQQMTVTTTTEGGDAWRRNSMEIKAVERVDGKTVLTGAFAKVTNP